MKRALIWVVVAGVSIGGSWWLTRPGVRTWEYGGEELRRRTPWEPGDDWEVVADGLEAPVHVVVFPDGSGRLAVVEQPGRVRLVGPEGVEPEPWLDLTGEVVYGGERGLLSVAFHPEHRDPVRGFVNFTREVGGGMETVVAEVSPGGSLREVLTVEQPFGNHNGGLLVFRPDGTLLIGLGDGGSAGDPHGHGQNRDTLLGAILRISVDGEEPYEIPEDNPFVGEPGREEIWAYGLRNPWRFALDPDDPDVVWVGDVGQKEWEEVDRIRAGANCGWRLLEGSHAYRPTSGLPEDLVGPVHEYPHSVGVSITGGVVYRGSAWEEHVGEYVFSDFTPGEVWGLVWEEGRVVEVRPIALVGARISSFGEDAEGELLVVDYSGRVLRPR